jgi:1-acyl-sn-glycerol-3-phosphate acyltransferase
MIWLRSLVFSAVFYVFTVVVLVVMTPTFLMPRQVCAVAMRVWGAAVTALLRWICGIRVEVRGRPPAGAALIAPKHQCMFDIFGSFAFLPDACFVLKKELAAIPFFGWYARKADMIVVDRGGHSKTLRKLVADGRDRMRQARQLVIFPEGTRGPPGVAGDYKPGVAALYRDLGIPCIPLALNTGVHWPAHGFIRRPGVIVFEFLEPIPPGLKRAQFMDTLESRLETASNALLAEGI